MSQQKKQALPYLILASSSVHRATLLNKLNIPFKSLKPDVDESPLAQESAEALVMRLSQAKAEAARAMYLGSTDPNKGEALIIGSDQVALIDNQILGKAGSFSAAKFQLSTFSARTVAFKTGLCVICATSRQAEYYLETSKVHFRSLTEAQIHNYLHQEATLDCAGSFKSEGLGVCLFNKIETRDPNSLVGLPLIGLVDLLARFGWVLPLGGVGEGR